MDDAPGLTLAEPTTSAIDALVDAAVAESTIPGLVLTVVRDGRTVHSSSRGAVAASSEERVSPATRFRIASMTKNFTATTVLAMRDAGLLGLDDRIARHAPELATIRPPTADSPPITIRHLLTMSAGLATDDPWADRHLGDTAAQMDGLFAGGATFAAAPGVRMDYSNFGYAMLGRVIESITGQRCSDVIRQRVLEPLGMHSTTWDIDGIDPSVTSVAVPHRVVDGTAMHEGSAPLPDGGFAPMGGLWSTADDLATWIGFMCDAFPPRDDLDRFGAVLSRASRREMQQVHRAYTTPTQHHGSDGRLRQIGVGYGMGLNCMHHVDLGHVVAHSGGLPGYGSNMRWVPDRGIGVVALANVTYAPMWRLTLAVLEALFDTGADLGDVVEPDDSLVRPATAALVELLSNWDDEVARGLFADNVLPDDPLDRRRRAAEELSAEHGALRLERLTALSRTEADAVLTGERGRVTLEVQLTPTVPPRIQWYEVIRGDEPAG